MALEMLSDDLLLTGYRFESFLTSQTSSESIQAYKTRIFVFSEELHPEKDPSIRAITAMYLAEAATALARLEVEEVEKARKAAVN